MTTSHKPCLTTRRTCPFCGEDFIEHDTSTDRIGTLGSIYIDGVHYIVPVKVVEFYKRAKGENVRLDQTDGKREAGHIRALLMLWQINGEGAENEKTSRASGRLTRRSMANIQRQPGRSRAALS